MSARKAPQDPTPTEPLPVACDKNHALHELAAVSPVPLLARRMPDEREIVRHYCAQLACEYPELPLAQHGTLERLALRCVEMRSLNRAIAALLQPPSAGMADADFDESVCEERLAALDVAIGYVSGASSSPCFPSEAQVIAEEFSGWMEDQARNGGALGCYGKRGETEAARMIREEIRGAIQDGTLPEEELDATNAQLVEDVRAELKEDDEELGQDGVGQIKRIAAIIGSRAVRERLSEPEYVAEVLTGEQRPHARDAGPLLELLKIRRKGLASVLRKKEWMERRHAAAQARADRQDQLNVSAHAKVTLGELAREAQVDRELHWNDKRYQNLLKQQEQVAKQVDALMKKLAPWHAA